MKQKLPQLNKVYPNDTNLLSFMFTIARNDHALNMFLTQIQFIREHPNLSELQVRRQLSMPYKAPEKLPKAQK